MKKDNIAHEPQQKSSEEFKTELLNCKDTILECITKLQKANMALSEIVNEYELAHVPDVNEAYKFANTVEAREKCTPEERHSWEYMYGYEKIMWLVNVALDYCFESKLKLEQEVC